MKIRLLCMAFIIFLCSLAYADFDVIRLEGGFSNVSQGSTLSGEIEIANTGTAMTELLFPSEAELSGPGELTVPASFSGSNILNTSESGNYTFSLSLPQNMPAGDYTAAFNITDNTSYSEIQNFNLNIAEEYVLELTGGINFGDVYNNETKTISFSIKNAGNANISNIQLSIGNNIHGIKLSPSDIPSLAAGDTRSINAELYVPFGEEEAGDLEIGTLKAASDQKDFTFQEFKVNIKSYLKLDRLSVEVDGKDGNYENGETINDKAKPRSEINFDIEVENLYEDIARKEIEVEDVMVKVTIFGIDNGDDIELESDSVVLDYEGNERNYMFELGFEVPDKADDDTYDIEIELTGEDEEGNEFETVWQVALAVERDSHELIIDNFRLSPGRISCDLKTVADLSIINLGDHDEEYVRYTIKNSELGVDEQKSRFEIEADYEDDDNIYEEKAIINIKEANPGTYPVELRVFRDFDLIEDVVIRNLVVERCGEQRAEEEEATGEGEEEAHREQEEQGDEEEEAPEEAEEEEETEEEELPTIPRQRPEVEESESGLMIGIPTAESFAEFRASDNYVPALLLLIVLIVISTVLIIALYLKK
ncbi:hypothetical protein GF323_02720 [Candidatus Woesearchaeota archaeon]|nr:hypothetical protein [Candidatus Woesearchaeota archaeon]